MRKNPPANYINDNEIKVYYLISFLFLNSFFAPVFRTALTYCNMKGEEYYSAYNNFITADAIYLKIIIFIYILFFLIAIPIIDFVPPCNKDATNHLILFGSCHQNQLFSISPGSIKIVFKLYNSNVCFKLCGV